MVERDTFVTIADGDQLNEGYFNKCYEFTKNSLHTNDTTTDLNVAGATPQTATKTYTVDGTQIQSYVVISSGGYAYLDELNSAQSTLTLKIETSVKNAASWTIRNNKNLLYFRSGDDIEIGTTVNGNLLYVPTQDEIDDGLDIKLTITSSGGSIGRYPTYTNIQVLIFKH